MLKGEKIKSCDVTSNTDILQLKGQKGSCKNVRQMSASYSKSGFVL